jgi:hypothetical protein
MSEMKPMPPRTDEDVHLFQSIRKKAGKCIDPATPEVEWTYAQTPDPYGVDPDLPEELQQVGREYFARAPGSNVWVWFGDLPEATRSALWERISGSFDFLRDFHKPIVRSPAWGAESATASFPDGTTRRKPPGKPASRSRESSPTSAPFTTRRKGWREYWQLNKSPKSRQAADNSSSMHEGA